MNSSAKPDILIDLGSGKNKIQDSRFRVVGIDSWQKADADIRASVLQLPLRTEVVSRIHTRHLFEHFGYENLVRLLQECYRILKPGGRLDITVPHYSCVSAFLDPTHRMFFTRRTFYKFGHLGFRVKEIRFNWFRRPYTGKFPFLINFVDKVVNRFQSLERFSPLIGGIYEIRCLMEKDAALLDPLHTDGAKIDD